MIDLSKVIGYSKDCLQSRSLMRAVILDLYPGQTREMNVLLDVYESGVPREIRSAGTITDSQYVAYVQRIVNDYGLQEKYVMEGLDAWIDQCICVGTAAKIHKPEILPIDRTNGNSQPQPIKHAPIGAQSVQNVAGSSFDFDLKTIDANEFRFFVTAERPSAVFCGSDGIDDSYANVEEMYALYRSILKIFVEHGIDVGKSEIKEYLPVLTKRGSGDDVSIALIMDIQRVTELTPVFTVQTELFNLEKQLKEKQHTVAVNEEKEKTLTSKMSAMMRPGIRTPLDHQIYNQINELRVTMTQMDEEILTLRRKIDNLKLRMPNVIAQCEPGMEEVEAAADSIVSEQSATTEETETHESVEMTASEPQKIVISEKTVTIAEQMAKVSQMAELPAVNVEAEVDTKASAAETPEE